MRETFLNSDIINLNPNCLWFLTLSYTIVIVLANWFDPRLIHIFGFDTDAGTLIFPLTFLLSNLITEVYGYKHARLAVWCGFLFNAVFILYGQMIIHLPSPDYQTNNIAFDSLLTMNARIIVASAISYLCSEPLNSFIMAKLKIKMNGRYLGLRFILSTLFAAGVDSFIFGYIAFFGIIQSVHLLSLIFTMWFIKVLIEVIGLPISIKLVRKLKQFENIDIYDRKTNFNLFRLDTIYSQADNEFTKHKV